MILPWASTIAVYTAKLAGEPEYGCTFTPHFSGSRWNASSALFWHSLSSSSTCSVPP
uniref:Uncharacterized protein n=1 Tax=Anguilla anguilla TaxID=7936 RepID=A0A0E9TF09_ANGAN